jgi:hypothetical protein
MYDSVLSVRAYMPYRVHGYTSSSSHVRIRCSVEVHCIRSTYLSFNISSIRVSTKLIANLMPIHNSEACIYNQVSMKCSVFEVTTHSQAQYKVHSTYPQRVQCSSMYTITIACTYAYIELYYLSKCIISNISIMSFCY